MDENTYATELERVSTYAQCKIDTVLKDMLEQLLAQTPDDPIDFMIGFLTDYKERGVPSYASQNGIDEMDSPAPRSVKMGRRRTAVSAEPLKVMSEYHSVPIMLAKTLDEVWDSFV
jgi:hypothetical protein